MAIIANGTDYVQIPVGTTAQRPGTPSAGMIRVNTTTNQYEVYISAQWNNFKSLVQEYIWLLLQTVQTI